MVFHRYRDDSPLETLDVPAPSQVVIPVGIPQSDLSLAVGEEVCTGQMLVRAEQIIPRHFHLSSVTGTVTGFIPHGKGMRAPVSVVVDRVAGDDRCGERFAMPATAETARRVLVRSGAMHACPPDVGQWLLRPDGPPIGALLVACFASGPLESGRLRLATCVSSRFTEGLALWRTAVGDAPVVLMVGEDDHDAWRGLDTLPESIRIHPCPLRYPAEHPLLLACRHLGRDLPGGSTPRAAGLLVIDIRAVCAAGEVMTTAEPLREVLVDLVGQGFARQVSVRVRIGTRVSDALENLGGDHSLLVAGGVLSGHHLDSDSPILPHHGSIVGLPKASRRFLGFMAPGLCRPSWTNTVLSSFMPWMRRDARAEIGGEHRPCISCGACEQVCPREISPSHLARVADAGIIEEMEQFGIDRCIECGLCSYVCPSKIELMGSIRRGIEALAQERAI